MKPTGEGSRSILFVAEAPGKQEDEEGVQLIGQSGQLLRDVLDRLDCDLDDCIKTNAVICRPEKNKIQELHIESCRPNLLNTIRELKPRVIVLLGGSSVRSLIPTEREEDAVGRAGRWVGWRIPSFEYQAWICPTYHPSYLLRTKDAVLEKMFREHLRQALRLEHKTPHGLDPVILKKQIEIIRSSRDARLRLKDLARSHGTVAFDYETTGLKPDFLPEHRIVACSFCLNGEGTFSFLVDESHHPLMSKVLKNKALRKVGHNLKMEERWTRAMLGHGVRGWFWDSMLASHILDNRGHISSLKFQAFVRFGLADYNKVVAHYIEPNAQGLNRIEECPKEDLLTYNGMDSLLTYKLMRKQRGEMGLA
jgi:DNA polymerase